MGTVRTTRRIRSCLKTIVIIMPKPLRPDLAEALPPEQPFIPTADTMRALGGIGLPYDGVVERMDTPGTDGERTGLNWEIAKTTHESTTALFAEILPGIRVPSIGEFQTAGVDFAKLERGYQGYEAAEMQPALLFAPVNLSLQSWRDGFSGLRHWQDLNHADSAFRLKNPSDGDGLYVWEPVANNWESLNRQAVNDTPGTLTVPSTTLTVTDATITWKALVVPTAPKAKGGLVTNLSHDHLSARGPALADLAGQAEAANISLDGSIITPQNAHMPIGANLTLHALRIHTKQPLMHEVISGFNSYTWNAGTFSIPGETSLRAPAVGWYSGSGRVVVNGDRVGDSGDDFGGRLPVWG